MERCGAEKVVCAGDVVGYGPDPVGAIRILRERGIESAMGNHDAAVAGWCNTLFALFALDAAGDGVVECLGKT